MTGPGNTWQNDLKFSLAQMERAQRHPCYSLSASRQYARMHLPVAPRCNISCNYCNRKFDCMNESRPGVTSEILTPETARKRFISARERIRNLMVVGIAGPGDALADWNRTRRTLEMIKRVDSQVYFCLSTNGLLLPELGEEIVSLGVKHVTVTVNCLGPQVGDRIYREVNYQGKKYGGVQGAEILIENQLQGIGYLARNGVLVKVNTVMIKGINEPEIPLVADRVKQLGAFISNIMPMVPAPGSAWEGLASPSTREIRRMRRQCQAIMRQMSHCQQCRADAAGLLSHDCSRELGPGGEEWTQGEKNKEVG